MVEAEREADDGGRRCKMKGCRDEDADDGGRRAELFRR